MDHIILTTQTAYGLNHQWMLLPISLIFQLLVLMKPMHCGIILQQVLNFIIKKISSMECKFRQSNMLNMLKSWHECIIIILCGMKLVSHLVIGHFLHITFSSCRIFFQVSLIDWHQNFHIFSNQVSSYISNTLKSSIHNFLETTVSNRHL